MIFVRIRDGRFGRDPALADQESGLGEVLESFNALTEADIQRALSLDVGQTITLNTGTRVVIVGRTETITVDKYTVDISIEDAGI